jgi:ABC-type antimicrobial peptide transport system, ATPase component
MAVVSLIGVSKYYKVGFTVVKALENINLEIKENEFVSVLGPSGSGKTTLLNMIGCLDKPTKGKVIFKGLDVTLLNDKKLSEFRANNIGFVFQTFNLLPNLTALENVEIASSFSNKTKNVRERAIELLNLVGLRERLFHKPSQLSGGEQQRVAIARALINDPEIILADEPTGNLDSKTAEEIMDLFLKLKKMGKTIVLVTHNTSLATKSDRIIYIKDGKIINETIKSV